MSEVTDSFTIDSPTLLSLAVAFCLMPAAQFLAATFLPNNTPKKLKYLFLWHAYDALTHTILEGSYLYHCFFSYTTSTASTAGTFARLETFLPQGIHFLGPSHADRRYGAFYADESSHMYPMARLWQEYAKADRRWGGADLTVISLELLTVFGAGPCAAYVCWMIARYCRASAGATSTASGPITGAAASPSVLPGLQARMWVFMIGQAVAELYGGFITFAPEWLSGSTNLRGDDPVYLWLYLVFFNTLWVFIPLWVIWEGYVEVVRQFERAGQVSVSAWKKES